MLQGTEEMTTEQARLPEVTGRCANITRDKWMSQVNALPLPAGMQ